MTDTPARYGRLGLILPFALVLAALVAWTIWWFILAHRVERELEVRAEALRQNGWTITHGPVSVDGWPFRTRLSLSQVEIIAPSGHGLATGTLVAEANAYSPLHWVVIAPDSLQLIRAGKGPVTVTAEAARLSASGVDRAWPRLAVELVRPVFTPERADDPFPIAAAERLALEARAVRDRPQGVSAPPAAPDDLDVLFQMVDGQGRADGPVEGLTGKGRLTLWAEATLEQAGALRGMDAAGVFDNWTRAGGRFAHVRIGLESGESRALMSGGPLMAGEDGRLTGSLELKAEQAAPALSGLAGSEEGAVDRRQTAAAAGVAATQQQLAQGQEPVTLNLEFRNGRTWLGPFALAPAPKLF